MLTIKIDEIDNQLISSTNNWLVVKPGVIYYWSEEWSKILWDYKVA